MPDFVDKTGQPPSAEDVAQAEKAVRTAMIRDLVRLMPVSPELAVQLPNIRRCLQTLSELLKKP